MVSCDVCGENDFQLVDGMYYCSLCHTQSQRLIEQTAVLAETSRFNPAVRIYEKKTESKHHVKTTLEGKKPFNIYEAFDAVLRTQVDCLLKQGAPEQLKDVILELWTSFLQKQDVSPVDFGQQSKPLSSQPRFRKRQKKRKRTEDDMPVPSESTFASQTFSKNDMPASDDNHTNEILEQLSPNGSLSLSSSMQLFEDTAVWNEESQYTADAVAIGQYDSPHCPDSSKTRHCDSVEISESQDPVQTILCESQGGPAMIRSPGCQESEDILDLKVSSSRPDGSKSATSEKKEKRTKTPSKKVNTLSCTSHSPDQSLPEAQTPYKTPKYRASAGDVLRLRHSLSFLYLSLLYLDLPVLLSDIFRWITSGAVPYINIEPSVPIISTYLPCAARFRFGDTWALPLVSLILCDAVKLGRYLDLWETKPFPPVTLSNICSRFLFNLNLPGELHGYVKYLTNMWVKDRWHEGLVDWEALTVAVIIISLKLLFGLNDKTERKLSDYARNKNTIPETKLCFVWDDWVKDLQLRLDLAKYAMPDGIRSILADRHTEELIRLHEALGISTYAKRDEKDAMMSIFQPTLNRDLEVYETTSPFDMIPIIHNSRKEELRSFSSDSLQYIEDVYKTNFEIPHVNVPPCCQCPDRSCCLFYKKHKKRISAEFVSSSDTDEEVLKENTVLDNTDDAGSREKRHLLKQKKEDIRDSSSIDSETDLLTEKDDFRQRKRGAKHHRLQNISAQFISDKETDEEVSKENPVLDKTDDLDGKEKYHPLKQKKENIRDSSRVDSGTHLLTKKEDLKELKKGVKHHRLQNISPQFVSDKETDGEVSSVLGNANDGGSQNKAHNDISVVDPHDNKYSGQPCPCLAFHEYIFYNRIYSKGLTRSKYLKLRFHKSFQWLLTVTSQLIGRPEKCIYSHIEVVETQLFYCASSAERDQRIDLVRKQLCNIAGGAFTPLQS